MRYERGGRIERVGRHSQREPRRGQGRRGQATSARRASLHTALRHAQGGEVRATRSEAHLDGCHGKRKGRKVKGLMRAGPKIRWLVPDESEKDEDDAGGRLLTSEVVDRRCKVLLSSRSGAGTV